MKVAVIGYSGSGKSTLAKKLGRIYQCPVLHLDRINFEPGWRERDPEDARRTVSGFLDENLSLIHIYTESPLAMILMPRKNPFFVLSRTPKILPPIDLRSIA